MQAIIRQSTTMDRTELIKSYGFVEQITSNENFLKESLDLAAKITGCQSAYISLLDDQKQYILSQNQSTLSTINVENSICQYTIKEEYLLEIENVKLDSRTKDLPLVQEGGIAFYAGSPLINSDNYKIGALCVMGKHPKNLNKIQRDILTLISKQIINALDQQRSLIKLIKEINTNFKPAACADLSCLEGELTHLQAEVINQNQMITAQKQHLEKVNKELNAFANIVAHDVKAPLRTIRSFAQLLERELVKNASNYTEEYFNFINKAILNLDELITDLLAFAKMDKDKANQKAISLSKILDIVLINLNTAIQSSNAQVEIPKEDFMIKGHKSHLVPLFQNLIANGIKYQSGENIPIIKIHATLHTSSEYSGSGIGLATCKKILDQIDSELDVTSTINKGSTFSFQLPKG